MHSNPCNYMDYGVETITTADYGYIWLYGCRPKSVSVDLGYSLG